MLTRLPLLASLAAVAVFLAGCGDKGKPTPQSQTTEFKGKKDPHDHSDHDRTNAKLEDAKINGKGCHAGLTAHLSEKEGNELEVFFETFDDPPKPVFLSETAKLTATVTRKGDDEKHTLEFKPAEKEERKDDPAGQCSRFSAEAKWMKAEDVLNVTLIIEGQPEKVVWTGFNPKKFAHVDE
jgi:hypothetical protein